MTQRDSSKSFYQCSWLALLLVCGLMIGGCVATGGEPQVLASPVEQSDLDQGINDLLVQLRQKLKYTEYEIAPVAVVSASVKEGGNFTRLDELISQRLIDDLQQNHELVILSRQHFFEYRDNRPFSISKGGGTGPASENLVVFSVGISPDDVLERAIVRLTAVNSLSQAIPGLNGSVVVDFKKEGLARQLHQARPQKNPYPLGIEERPYRKVDRLTSNLASELLATYRAGGFASGQTPADSDVRVVLTTMPSPVAPRLVLNIISALQQDIVARQGFTCAINPADYSSFDQMIRFYESNPSFTISETRLSPATVFLFAEILHHPNQGMVSVSLRGAWRIDPTDKELGGVIKETAGNYLSGFTARAYLKM